MRKKGNMEGRVEMKRGKRRVKGMKNRINIVNKKKEE